MKPLAALALPLLLLSACAGDNHVTTQSPRESARQVAPTSAGSRVNRPEKVTGKFSPTRVYLITRLETADQPRGEWRAQGGTINERGSEIEFTELGSGKFVSFTAPHQITPMDSHTDRAATQALQEGGPATPEAPARYP